MKVAARNQDILSQIKELKSDHPFWGHRRVWAYLKYRQGLPVNRKRILRLMREHSLLVTREQRLKAKRGPYRPKPQADRPNQFWGIDMTKIKISSYGWLYLTVVLDWYTKEIIGYHLGLQSKTSDWLQALHQAVDQRYTLGIKDTLTQPLFLISDNGCQPTSTRFMAECSTLGIKQIFTTWSNPKGNADTERVFRTLKEDLVWTHDWDNPFVFAEALKTWINAYNSDFPHQGLKYLTPGQSLQNYQIQRASSNLFYA